MKKIISITCILIICFNAIAQKKQKEGKIDNGYCLLDDPAFLNQSLSENKKISLLLKSADKEYTGQQALYSQERIGYNSLGVPVVKVGTVDYAVKRNSDSLCFLKQFLVVRKYHGGGTWGSPYLSSFLSLPDVKDIYSSSSAYGGGKGFFPKWKSCDCIEKSKNWLEGNTSTSDEGTESTVKRVKDVVPNTKLSNGPYEEMGGDGIVYKTGQYDNGKKVGTWIYYGKGGKSAGIVEKEENYKDDELDGEVKAFDEKGSVKFSAEYKNGKLHGKTKYYEKGVLVMEEQNIDGERNGKMIKYYNGKKESETDFVNAQMNGQEVWYFIETGKVKKITSYKDDKQNGPYKHFNKDGSIYEEGAFKDGYKEGEWKKYDSSGKVIEKIFYVKGQEEK